MPHAQQPRSVPLGYGSGKFYALDVASQEDALIQLAAITAEDTADPTVRKVALAAAHGCASRDDICELTAIFNLLRYGPDKIKNLDVDARRILKQLMPGLRNGLKYMSDPRYRDFYTGPARLLAECADGVCAEDCDSHAMLGVALAGSLGYVAGLRAWGPKGSDSYEHVYAVAMIPKEGDLDGKDQEVFGLDTSADVGEPYPGWEPPEGNVFTAWLEGDES